MSCSESRIGIFKASLSVVSRQSVIVSRSFACARERRDRIGTTFRGRVVKDTMVGELPAIVLEVEGEAYIIGERTFLIAERDPLAFGFRL